MVFLKEADAVHRVVEIQKQLAEAMGAENGTVDIGPAYELAMQRMKTVIIDQFHLKTHLLVSCYYYRYYYYSHMCVCVVHRNDETKLSLILFSVSYFVMSCYCTMANSARHYLVIYGE